ncbi:hypothetical protein COCCADRAFT_91639 [Bipolaris zeicola 26-R-13]|uniref:DUF967 domain protein n=1 Tax=Cochliobolus carbonum (strain 26-R-13) TaxID=930089 RepID=W6YHH6_COCC2|nr:uncharacterized protein COCCADRAFT_91639 [Bipolaris zeicola 26-R-13]EUC35104.1 hypothetical protein COCCADRAFT_91639 [Bipolaris zeicola 26-R-13]
METPDVTVPNHTPIATAPRDIDAIKAQEKDCTLPFWNGDVAFKLGVNLRTRLLTEERPAVVHISTISTPPHVLFHAVTHPGTSSDNDIWISRKRAAVIRFAASTWRLQNQYGGDEEAFKAKLGLGETAGQYAIHGGGVPVFIKGCDGMVAVVVVSGLKQWDDHQVVVEEMVRLRGEMERVGGVV